MAVVNRGKRFYSDFRRLVGCFRRTRLARSTGWLDMLAAAAAGFMLLAAG
jgi:hypothetical protein